MSMLIRQCEPADLEELRELSYRTYDKTFRHLNTPENMDAYLATAFNKDRLREELARPGSTFYFLTVDGVLAGYLKINEADAQSDLKGPDSLELERVYVDAPFQGRGLGKLLIQMGLDQALLKRKSFAWLGVWEKNEKAIRFYGQFGFRKIGTYDFFMGDERQTDFVMRRDLP